MTWGRILTPSSPSPASSIPTARLRRLDVLGMPTSFVVDPEGRILMRAVGDTEFDDPALVEALRRQLPEGR